MPENRKVRSFVSEGNQFKDLFTNNFLPECPLCQNEVKKYDAGYLCTICGIQFNSYSVHGPYMLIILKGGLLYHAEIIPDEEYAFLKLKAFHKKLGDEDDNGYVCDFNGTVLLDFKMWDKEDDS